MPSQCQQLTAIITHFMQTAQQSLTQIITSLQSDQLLQQMRNDQNLYHQKINYINELIKHHFIIQPINPLLLNQIQQLKSTKQELQNRLDESKEQYISELTNIQVQYKEFLLEKENQKKLMENTIQQKNHQISILNKNHNIKTKDLQIQVQNLSKQLQITKNTHNQTQLELQQSQRQNEKLKKQLQSLKNVQKQHLEQNKMKASQLSTKYTQIQDQNQYLKSQLNIMEQKITSLTLNQEEYLEAINKMKEDMFLIKDQWQKKCLETQRDLSQNYRSKLIQHEDQMNHKLRTYMEELKMGKNVIIQSSEQILQSKKQLMQQRFNTQMKRYQDEIKELENCIQQQKKRFKQLSEQLKSIQQKLSLKQTELQQTKFRLQNDIKHQQTLMVKKQQELTTKLTSLKTQTDKEIQRLRKTENMLLKDLKASKLQKEQIQKEVNIIRDEFNNLKDKQQKQSKRLKELQHSHEQSTTKILQLKKDLAITRQKSTMDEKSLKDKNNEIHRLQNNLIQLKNQYKDLDTVTRKLQIKIAELNLKSKQHQRIKSQQIHKLQKLYLTVRKLSKQLSLVKQDISFQINIQKKKLQTIILAITQQISLRQQTIKLSNKQKIKELLDDFEEERRHQRVEQDQLLRENQNMKKEIKLLEQLMQQKEEDYLYNRERTVNLQVEKCRLIMQEQINKEREQRRKLQQKLYNQEKRYEYLIAKAQKQVSKQVNSFMTKWQTKISHLQSVLLSKQKTLKQTTVQLKRVCAQYDNLQTELQQKEEKVQKYQRKYQSLKQQRDKTVEQMMKRLQKQTKHKLALERELKDIRGQIMKTQTNTNTSSPFNNYSFTDRENTNVYTNAFQATTQDKMKTHVKHTNREKQLSEIREMIAKTYKVVQGAEKDSPVHKGKLF